MRPLTTRPKKPLDDGGRSGRLRPGRVRNTNTAPPRMPNAAKNLLRISSMTVAKTRSATKGGGKARSPLQRRAIVNVRYSANSKTPGSWKAHGTYVERESATKDQPVAEDARPRGPETRDTSADRLGLAKTNSVSSLADSWQKAGDKRLFKIILSPEDPGVDFEATAADVVARIEQYTNAPLEWAGVVHRNTDHPHAHLIVRGRLPSGEELKLPPALIRSALREAAQTSITRQLGPRTMEDVQRQRQAEVTATRVTSHDRTISKRLQRNQADPQYDFLGSASGGMEEARLRHLAKAGLAKNDPTGHWLVRPDFRDQLTEMKSVQDRARTLFRSGVAISDPHSPMEFSTSSRKLIGRVLLNSEEESTGVLQTIVETTDGKIQIMRHDGPLRSAWGRGDLRAGNVIVIDALRSDPSKLYVSSAGTDAEVLTDKKALDSIARRAKTMGLIVPESSKGWMGQFSSALRTRTQQRTQEKGY